MVTIDEEEEDLNQDDLKPPEGDAAEGNLLWQEKQRRFFYQMTFDMIFPHEDDTVYLAYSRPYPYSHVLAHMFDVEQKLSDKPMEKIPETAELKPGGRRRFTLKITRHAFQYERSLLCTTICGLPMFKLLLTAN